MKNVTAEELLKKLHDSGYFENEEYLPMQFIRITENRIGISRDSAVKLLTDSGFCTFEYAPFTPDMHFMDRWDFWKVTLTEKGKLQLFRNSNMETR